MFNIIKSDVENENRVALYVWDYAGEMQLMRYFWNGVSELFSDGANHDEGKQFPICKPKPLADLFRATNLEAVEVHTLDAPTEFTDFNDYWSPFLRGQGPAGSYCLSGTEGDREHLRNHLERTMPVRSDGSIHLIPVLEGFGERFQPESVTRG